MSANKNEAKAWTLFHQDGSPTSSGSDYQGENLHFFQSLIVALGAGRMLDIGTGNMPIPKLALAQGSDQLELYAIDVADIKPAFRCEGVVFKRESSEATSFSEGYFDLVTGSYALEYSNIQKSLEEIVRILKPGGKAGFIMHHPDSLVVQRMTEAHDNDISMRQKLDSLKKLETFVAKPTLKNRRVLEKTVAQLEELEEMTSFNMFRGVVDAMQLILNGYANGQPVEAEAFDKWMKGTLQKIKGTAYRHKLMQDAIVHDTQSVAAVLSRLGVNVQRFDEIASEVYLGEGPGGEIQQGVIGWALVFEKTNP